LKIHDIFFLEEKMDQFDPLEEDKKVEVRELEPQQV